MLATKPTVPLFVRTDIRLVPTIAAALRKDFYAMEFSIAGEVLDYLAKSLLSLCSNQPRVSVRILTLLGTLFLTCRDSSDEAHCQHACAADEYTCNNKHCIPRTWLCDGQGAYPHSVLP